MPDVNEGEVFSRLLRYRLEQRVSSGDVDLVVRLRPVDNHAGDSPDFLLWAELEFELLGQPVKIAVPVPVEAEKGGIYGGALDDLRKFVDRRRHVIQMPMIVVAEGGFQSKEQVEQVTTNFSIQQVPVRRI